MTRSFLIATALFAGLIAISATAADDAKVDAAKAKKGLQAVGEFIGTWGLTGESKAAGKTTSWKEPATWVWGFKGDDSWIAIAQKDSKYFTKGELRFLPTKKLYELKATDKDGKEQVFTGELKKGKLTLDRTEEKSNDVHRLMVTTLAEGIRLQVQYQVQSGGKGLFNDVYKSTGNKDGESFAGGGAKKPECIVTGGTATIAVSHAGKTYYVCCSGCKEEFVANPQKYIDAAEKAKK